MNVKLLFLIVFILLKLEGCKEKITDMGYSVVDSSFIKYSIINPSDSVIIINGIKLTLYFPFNSNEITNITSKSTSAFLESNIQFYKIDTLILSQFYTEMYFRAFLKSTRFLEFEESSFKKENFVFSSTQANIKNYGTCIIGKYYFNNAVNAAQRRVTVIINSEKNELSIWNFDNVNINKEGITCDFNVRGKHSFYDLNYSAKSNRFIAILK